MGDLTGSQVYFAICGPAIPLSSSSPLDPSRSVTQGSRILGQHGVLGPSIYQEGDWLPPDVEGYPGFRGGLLLTLTSLVT